MTIKNIKDDMEFEKFAYYAITMQTYSCKASPIEK